MTKLMPLRKAVVELTNEALPDDAEDIRRAIKSWHNRLHAGSVPRSVITKLGRELFLNLEEWENWVKAVPQQQVKQGPGRPRGK